MATNGPTADPFGDLLKSFEGDPALDEGRAERESGHGEDEDTAQARKRPRAVVPGPPDETAPIPGGGALLEEPDETKLFDALDRGVRRQHRLASNRYEGSRHYARVVAGSPFSYLEKSEDRSVVKACLPPGIADGTSQPVPNKVADLKRKIVSQVLVDTPLPNPKADGDSDRARGAADLSRKFLRADGLPMGTNDAGLSREALNTNMTTASSFVWVWVDRTAGGWRPKQMMADPQAVDPSFPFVGPQGIKTGDPVLRYVSEEEAEDPTMGEATTTRAFVDDPAAAARLWLPKVRAKLLRPEHVRCHPPTATVFDAEAVTLLICEPLAEARRRFRILDELDDRTLRAVCRWRPKAWQRLVPEALRAKIGESEAEITDDTLVFWYHHFCAISPRYVDGAELAVNGAEGGIVLLRDTLRDDVELEDGTTVPVLRDIPVSQYIAQMDTEGGDPFGIAGIADFAGGNEMMAQLLTSILDAIDKGLNPIPFIPSTSPVTREDLTRRDGTPVEILTKDDAPEWERPPQLPPFTFDVLDRIEAMLNSAAGTNETANGLDSSYSVSGEAKKVAIRQAKVALAQYWANFILGLTRYWTIKVQLAQGRLTVPQIVKLTGEEAAYKQRWWVGADLVGVTDVALQPGTGTMMAPAEKANYLTMLQQMGWIDPVQAGEVARGSMSDDLGLERNTHEERIDRAIADWNEGPPPGWEATHAQNEAALQQRQLAVTQTAQALADVSGVPIEQTMSMAEQEVPPPQLVPEYDPFTPRPNDEEPGVAKIQQAKLSRLISTPDYTKWPVAWRSLVDRKYATACYAAGVVTMRQQFEAQQNAAAQAAATQATDKATARADQQGEADANRTQAAQEADKNRAHVSAEAEKDRAAGLAQGAQKGTQALQQLAVKSALAPAPERPMRPI